MIVLEYESDLRSNEHYLSSSENKIDCTHIESVVSCYFIDDENGVSYNQNNQNRN